MDRKHGPHLNFIHIFYIRMQNSVLAFSILSPQSNLGFLHCWLSVSSLIFVYVLTSTFTAIQTIIEPKTKVHYQDISKSVKNKNWTPFPPLRLSQELPHCRCLASVRISITRVANSWALNLANFWRPWENKKRRKYGSTVKPSIHTPNWGLNRVGHLPGF